MNRSEQERYLDIATAGHVLHVDRGTNFGFSLELDLAGFDLLVAAARFIVGILQRSDLGLGHHLSAPRID